MEIWKPVVGHEDIFEISNMGNVKRISRRGKVISNPIIRIGYLSNTGYRYEFVKNSITGKKLIKLVHAMVLEAFVGPRPYGFEAAHLNGCRQDNRQDNLIWTSCKENNSHKKLHGTQPIGEKVGGSKLKEWQVIEIKKMKKTHHKYIKDAAAKYGVSVGNIIQIRNGRIWKSINL